MAVTPMMRQYLQMKEDNPGCLLFFRLGDFYEMFFDDAVTVSRELELTLTGKDCGLAERAPMCGVPYHAVDAYLSRLIEKGYKVAICEQMTDPSESKGLVERAITRIVTPGTVIEAQLLNEREPSYIMAVCLSGRGAGLAFADVSTGEFYAYSIRDAKIRLADELTRVHPREILLADEEAFTAIVRRADTLLSVIDARYFEYADAAKRLQAHFGKPVKELVPDIDRASVGAAGALMQYLTETQKNALGHIMTIAKYESEQYMTLNRVAKYNLELTESGRDRRRAGSLLGVLDKSVTAMGSRMLRAWIEQPLICKDKIDERLDAVQALILDRMTADALREQLRGVRDVERLLSRIAYESVNARDCIALRDALTAIPYIQSLLEPLLDVKLLNTLRDGMQPLDSLTTLLVRAIEEDAPLTVKEGGIFKTGYSEELDKLRVAATDGKSWIAQLEKQEREDTGIKNLKIGYNRVFGYYIEVTKSFYELVPYRYARKQTLANCERYVTQELKEIEKTVTGADEQAIKLEYQMFGEIREQLKEKLPELQKNAHALKTLDALLALAQAAVEYDYIRPTIVEEGALVIRDGRHPSVEQSIGRDRFVPNDTTLSDETRVMIITGPNMAGKSTYLRQVALITLMAHVGSFVPASEATIPITDRIFTRIGASDDLYGGQSTFMVEMTEMATILKNATDKSLIILDEVGRGTSTFDGLSIAWAAVEYIVEKIHARTLFATHYHELSELEGQLDGVKDYRITAKEQGEDVIFLRKIVPGGADRSFGVAVASLAGLPHALIMRARQIMARLEVNNQSAAIGQSILDKRKNAGNRQVQLTDYRPMELVEELRAVDVMGLSPIDALNKLFELNEKARRI